VAKNDGKIGRLNSVGWSQQKTEISQNNPKALTEGLSGRQDNDTASMTRAPNNPQNRPKQNRDPTPCNAHTEDSVRDEARETSPLIEKSP
jgi:hypothetical protein